MTNRRDRLAPTGKGICLKCAHYTGIMQCKAFPKQIPIEVFIGEFDHHKAHKDDKGIQFTER